MRRGCCGPCDWVVYMYMYICVCACVSLCVYLHVQPVVGEESEEGRLDQALEDIHAVIWLNVERLMRLSALDGHTMHG